MKLPLGDLNLGSCPPHPISTYTYGVTIAPRVCNGSNFKFWFHHWLVSFKLTCYWSVFAIILQPKKKKSPVITCLGLTKKIKSN